MNLIWWQFCNILKLHLKFKSLFKFWKLNFYFQLSLYEKIKVSYSVYENCIVYVKLNSKKNLNLL